MVLGVAVDLYLPISQEMLCEVIDADMNCLEKVVSNFELSQLASLLLLQNLSKVKGKYPANCERLLADTIDILSAKLKHAGRACLVAEIVPTLNIESIQKGAALLKRHGVGLLDTEAVQSKDYLNSDGKWDYEFNTAHRDREGESLVAVHNSMQSKVKFYSSEQSRLTRELSAQIDDPIHIQGYAGTGKSFLIGSFVEMLNTKANKVLILAERRNQLDALGAHLNSDEHVVKKTFVGLAREIISQRLDVHENRSMQRRVNFYAVMPDSVIASHFNVMPSGELTAIQMVQVVRGVLAGFCYSGDEHIQLKHIPTNYLSKLNEAAKQAVLYYAGELWKVILFPVSKDFMPPVKGYHLIKWVALNGWKIPSKYTHVLIDECHELAKPMLQILDSSSQAVISLGDEYQNLQGRSQQRANIIRYREICHSVRSGCLIEEIINPIIAAHPGRAKAYFYGNQSSGLEVVYYAKAQVPQKPSVILVNDMWGLFEWAQRIASENLSFRLLTDFKKLNTFVNDCIDLHRYGTRARHGELFRFESWAALKDSGRYSNNPGFHRIDRMLHHGYQYDDWQKTLGKATKSGSLSYALGRVEDVRNHEFSTVMLTPEVVGRAQSAKKGDVAAVSSAIYVAVTRATQCLFLPEELRGWVEEISSR